MSIEEQIKSSLKKRYFQIRNVGKMKKYVNEKNCTVLVKLYYISH